MEIGHEAIDETEAIAWGNKQIGGPEKGGKPPRFVTSVSKIESRSIPNASVTPARIFRGDTSGIFFWSMK